MTTRRIPAPQAQAFVACRKITNDPQTGEIVITGPVSHVPIVMLLDRTADVHLARRSGAESWLVKPIDALSIRRAVDRAINPVVGTPVLDAVAEVAQDGEPAVSG